MHLHVSFGRYAFQFHRRNVFKFESCVLFVVDVRTRLRHCAVKHTVDEIEDSVRASEIAVEINVRPLFYALFVGVLSGYKNRRVGKSETVYTLFDVPDHKALAFDELTYDRLLRGVDVLILVHKHRVEIPRKLVFVVR